MTKQINFKKLMKSYELILKIRYAEDLLGKKKKKGFINSPVPLSAGQEAIPVGISLNRKSGVFVLETIGPTIIYYR